MSLVELYRQAISDPHAASVLTDAYEQHGTPPDDQRAVAAAAWIAEGRMDIASHLAETLPVVDRKRRKRIDKMTAAETARMASYAQEWIRVGLSTARADRPLFEAAIAQIWRLMGYPVPRIIWCPAPIISAMAGPIAMSMRNGGAVDGAVCGAVGDAVGVAVSGAVRDAVGGAVGDAVDDAVSDAVGDAVRVAVRVAVSGAVGDAVGGAVRGAVRGAVYGAVSSAVGGAVYGAVSGAVGGAVRDAVGDAVGSAVDDAVGTAVGDAVGVAVERNWHRYMGGQFWAGWYWGPAYALFMIDVLGLDIGRDLELRARAYADTVRSACWWWPSQEFVIVSERPTAIDLNADGSLRCARWEWTDDNGAQQWEVTP